MITRNDSRLGLANGETGMLKGEWAHFAGKEAIARAALPSFEYAYALSVHKSQGSEYERVLFFLPPGSEVFGREVLYTGVTRGKKLVVLVGMSKALFIAVNNDEVKKRHTGLQQALMGMNPANVLI